MVFRVGVFKPTALAGLMKGFRFAGLLLGFGLALDKRLPWASFLSGRGFDFARDLASPC